jgi:hypothetical protein
VSTPAHFNDIVIQGSTELIHKTHGHITAILVQVDDGAGAPCAIIVWPRSPPSGEVRRGDLLRVRGTLRCDPADKRRSLHYIDGRVIEVLRPNMATTSFTPVGN